MKYNIRKNWSDSFGMILKNPALLMPFVLISFFEILALELIYFSTRFPLSVAAAPVIRKFFGEQFLHYPASLAIVPNFFYNAQIGIYIVVGVLLMAVSVNIFRNIKEKLPVMANAMLKNSLKHYGRFFVYGVIVMAMVAVVRPLDSFIFGKAFRLMQRLIPGIPSQLGNVGFMAFLFLTNFFIQAVFIASVPFMVLEKKPLFRAILASVLLFFRNFFKIIILVGLPFFVYLPIVILKNFSAAMAEATSPEIILVITVFSSIASVFIDCFTIVCACQFVADISKSRGKKA